MATDAKPPERAVILPMLRPLPTVEEVYRLTTPGGQARAIVRVWAGQSAAGCRLCGEVQSHPRPRTGGRSAAGTVGRAGASPFLKTDPAAPSTHWDRGRLRSRSCHVGLLIYSATTRETKSRREKLQWPLAGWTLVFRWWPPETGR
jgi:hypothetical protein